MFTNRFSMPDDAPKAAKLLFENAYGLQISLTRSKGGFGPLVMYELQGGFERSDGDLPQIMREILDAFADLPEVKGADDEEDD